MSYPPGSSSSPLSSLVPTPRASYESLDSTISPKSQIFTHHTRIPQSIRESVPLSFKSTSNVDEIWNQEKQARAKAEQEHVRWLTSVEDGKYQSYRGGGNTGWIPTGPGRLLPPTAPEEIEWGSAQPRRHSSVIHHLPSSIWDEYGSLAFDYARGQQEAQQSALSHLEFDVEGKDAHGNRVRVQKFLEIWLDVRKHISSRPAFPDFERSVMKMKHICILRAPHPQAFPVLREEEREPVQIALERLAQNEGKLCFCWVRH
jgi:hypothetical protein